MKCVCIETEELHSRTKRRIARCVRCKAVRLMPLSGKGADKIDAECRAFPFWHEFGYWLSLILAACLITPDVIARLNYKLGLTEIPECSCADRVRWLNTLGGRLCSSNHVIAKWLAWLLVRRSPVKTE
jgi:hypothetical protein